MYLVSWSDYDGDALRVCTDKDILMKLIISLKSESTKYKVYEAKEIIADVQLVIGDADVSYR
jgi:homoaconitase/3-isopropylmalate dehydratase large subunit